VIVLRNHLGNAFPHWHLFHQDLAIGQTKWTTTY